VAASGVGVLAAGISATSISMAIVAFPFGKTIETKKLTLTIDLLDCPPQIDCLI
jgi:hypothetical protein